MRHHEHRKPVPEPIRFQGLELVGQQQVVVQRAPIQSHLHHDAHVYPVRDPCPVPSTQSHPAPSRPPPPSWTRRSSRPPVSPVRPPMGRRPLPAYRAPWFVFLRLGLSSLPRSARFDPSSRSTLPGSADTHQGTLLPHTGSFGLSSLQSRSCSVGPVCSSPPRTLV